MSFKAIVYARRVDRGFCLYTLVLGKTDELQMLTTVDEGQLIAAGSFTDERGYDVVGGKSETFVPIVVLDGWEPNFYYAKVKDLVSSTSVG